MNIIITKTNLTYIPTHFCFVIVIWCRNVSIKKALMMIICYPELTNSDDQSPILKCCFHLSYLNFLTIINNKKIIGFMINLYKLLKLQIHWFSIFNSFMMVIFLVGLVSMILMRTLRKDYARYSKEDDLDDMVCDQLHLVLQVGQF